MSKIRELLFRRLESPNVSINGFLMNPFQDRSQQEMIVLVREFMDETGLDSDWTILFTKAAFLGQDKEAFARDRDDKLKLKQLERRALQREDPTVGNKYNQPFLLYGLVACCSLAAAIQGMDESAFNQVQTSQAFLNTMLGRPNGKDVDVSAIIRNPPWQLGLMNSAPYLCCAVFGCWLTDPLNHVLGRRGTIFLCCFFSCASCVAQAFTNHWRWMFLARLFLGIGIGPKSATVPIYASECSPKEIRGGVVMMWQVCTALGIMLGYLAGVIFDPIKNLDLQWRLIVASPVSAHSWTLMASASKADLDGMQMLIHQMVLPIVCAAYIYILPESPRWLLKKARRSKKGRSRYYEQAFESFRRVRSSDLQAARDMFLVYHTLMNEEIVFSQNNRWFELIAIRRNRNAFVASTICMFMQQMCGVNILAYYSTLVLQSAEDNSGSTHDLKVAKNLSLGFGVINFVFALPAIPLIDNFGRRNLLLSTFPFMAIFQLLTGLGFKASGTTKKVLVSLGMYLFCIAYSPGEGPVPFVYASESMPLYVRDIGTSAAVSLNWLFNFVLSISFPRFIAAAGPAGVFGYYACWCVIGWWLILLFVPETRNQTLEELDARFSVSAREHARHSLRELQWFIIRYVAGNKNAPRPQPNMSFTASKKVHARHINPRKIAFDDHQKDGLAHVEEQGDIDEE